MDTIAMNPLPTISTFHGQGDTTISTATEAITELACQLVEKLNERSTALANGAQFDLALRDAAFIRLLKPTSFLGYLKAGIIHQQQGHQRAAIAMYDQGLFVATSSNDPGYTQLAACRKNAMHADGRRIDFISQLPNHLVATNIVPLLFDDIDLMDPETPCPYLDVSPTWQQRILQCNPFSYSVDMNLIDNPHQPLKYGSHTKSLWMSNMQGPPADHKMVAFLKHDWPHLSHLFIGCIVARSQKNLLDGLALVGKTLTRLIITILDPQVSNTFISLRDILDTCPHLQSLEASGIDYTIPDMLSVSYPNMTHLNLHNLYRNAIPYEMMVNIISHLPSLLSFAVSPMPDARLLTIIQDYCPQLTLLCYGTQMKYDLVYKDKQGLEKLAIGEIHDEYNVDDVMSLVKQHHATLQEIQLAGAIDASRVSQHDDPTLEFKHLRTLSFKCDPEFFPLAAWIICRAPFIERLTIITDLGGDMDLFGVVSPMQLLKSLRLWAMPPYWESIHQLIQHHIRLGDHSPLQELHLALHHETEVSPWLCAIPQLCHLTSLKISIEDRNIPDTYKAVMDTLAQGCLNLESLELDCENIVPPGIILAFHQHPRLNRVHVSGNGLHWSDILGLVAIPKLTSLVLEIPQVPDDIRQLLQSKISFVDIK